MSTVTTLQQWQDSRAQAFQAFEPVLVQCTLKVAQTVGADGLKVFFDGYKDSQELKKQAA